MATVPESVFERQLLEIESGGSAIEAFAGLGVIVLSILGLAGAAPTILAASAGIVFGVALLAQGAAVATEYSVIFSKVSGGPVGEYELGGGMTIELLAGGAAVVLGILALIGVMPAVLLPALVIASGTALILTTGELQRLNTLKTEATGSRDTAQKVASYAVTGVAGAQFLAGLAAMVLGILALVHFPTAVATPVGVETWMTFTLVGLLVLGCSITMSGGALAGRLMQMFNRIRPQR